MLFLSFPCHLAVKPWAHETKSTLRTEPTRAVNEVHGVANEQAVPSVGKQCTLRYILICIPIALRNGPATGSETAD